MSRLTIELANAWGLETAQNLVERLHYLRSKVDPRARPMAYLLHIGDHLVGAVILGIPHATKCNGWWGYPNLPTQWQVVDIARIWLHPGVQSGGDWCEPINVPGFYDRRGEWRPAVASWAIAQVLSRVQADRVRLWPPVYPDQPYHIELAISYHDPKFHKGTIYRQSQATPMYVRDGQPAPGPSGKYGWAWRLPRPAWDWNELTNIQPRTLRLQYA